jgi:Protein of unknown function (DUF3048) N-terminal domain/Protein of unknown function (DUF3048) C-terminal domain
VAVHLSRGALISAIGSALAVLVLAGGFFLLTRHPARHPAAAPRPTKSVRPPLTSPFTGEPVKSLGPELIFKIDNVPQARPPTGLTEADIIYLLPVEGGLSRIFAVFSSHFPPVVGPVRSAREEDISLLRQFGRPAFAFSGAQPRLLPVVQHARIIDLYDGLVGGYFRSADRIAPYNLYAHTKTLLAEAKGASKAHDIGFRFGSAPSGGTPTKSFSMSYEDAAFRFVWSAQQQRWLVWMDGKPAFAAGGGQLGGPTVVIQYVRIGTSGFLELGIRPPYAQTVGSGTALVLRDGRAYRVHWSRPTADGGTAFTLPDGQPMPFARGQVWIAFARGPGSTAD